MSSKKTQNPSREVIKKLSKNLKAFVTSAFEESKSETRRKALLATDDESYHPADILSLHWNFREGLMNESLPSSDVEEEIINKKILSLLISSLKISYSQRLVTAAMTTFLVKFTDYIHWINIWYNHGKGKRFSILTTARRKALLSEFTKLLLKSASQVYDNPEDFCSLQPPQLRDLFGLKCITAASNVDELIDFIRVLVLVLTNPDSEEHKNFFSWVENTNQSFGNVDIPKGLLSEFQTYSFELHHEKNYLQKPKGKYQSWQATLTVKSAPDTRLIGKDFEIIIMNWEMFENAEIGEAAHDDYKKEVYELTEELFPTKGHRQEFFCEGLDKNGLVDYVHFYQRQSSGTTIPKNN